MVKFISTEIVGFGSIVSPIYYRWDKAGLNIIKGENGVGKSSILNALSWCLFKQLLKKGSSIEPWAISRDESYKGTKVTTLIDVDGKLYTIIRCKDYKGKIFGKNGGDNLYIIEGPDKELDIRNKDEKQEFIHKLLGYSFTLFKSSTLIGQKMKKLMEEDGPEKKKILEQAFDVSFISQARVVVEKRLAVDRPKLMIAKNEYDFTKIRLQDAVKQRAKLDEYILEFETKKAKRIKAAKRLAKETKQELKETAALIKDKDYEALIANKKRYIAVMKDQKSHIIDHELKESFRVLGLKDKAEVIYNELEALKDQMSNLKPTLKCESCGQLFKDADAKKKHYQKEKAKLVEAYQALKERYDEMMFDVEKQTRKYKKLKQETEQKVKSLEEEHNKVTGEIYKLVAKQSAQKILKEQMKTLNDQYKYQKGQVDIISAEKCNFNVGESDQEIHGLKKQKKKLYRVYDSLKEEVDMDEWLIKDPLSNSGLKSFIFDSMLAKLNNHLKTYTPYTKFGIEVVVDMQSANKDIRIIINKKGHKVLYEDLSGGQQQSTNIALIFALHDCVTISKPVNILILDEVFESLSKTNLELVSDIIKAKANKKTIHLITHLSDFSPSNSHITELILNKKEQTEVVK